MKREKTLQNSTETKCKHCACVFRAFNWKLKNGRGIFCSPSCAAKDVYLRMHKGEYTLKSDPAHVPLRDRRKQRAHLLKIKARHDVHAAVKNGTLVKTPCIICGDLKSEGHHKDYSKPLDVEWLCRSHHKEADKRDGTRVGDLKPVGAKDRAALEDKK